MSFRRLRLWGAVVAAGLLTACANTEIQTQGYYHAPQKAYTLPLNSHAFRGQVTLTEQCDKLGGTLNVWDAQNRFFRVDYLKINQHELAKTPPFASDRTIDEIVLANYMRKVIPGSESIKIIEQRQKNFIKVRGGEGLFAVISMQMKPEAVPELYDPDHLYYYGFLVFKKGDMAYVVQHRYPFYQPDRLRKQLITVAEDLTIPGKPPAPNELQSTAEQMTDSFNRGVQAVSTYALGTTPPSDKEKCE